MTTNIQPMTQREVEAKVLQASGAIALDFYQASCAPCRALEPRLERVAAQYSGRVSVYRIDIDRDMPVAERFRVASIPTVLVFRDGKQVQRLDGLITETDLRAAFDRAGQG
jgi:thioredoxin